jgi:hypothetical protein
MKREIKEYSKQETKTKEWHRNVRESIENFSLLLQTIRADCGRHE